MKISTITGLLGFFGIFVFLFKVISDFQKDESMKKGALGIVLSIVILGIGVSMTDVSSELVKESAREDIMHIDQGIEINVPVMTNKEDKEDKEDKEVDSEESAQIVENVKEKGNSININKKSITKKAKKTVAVPNSDIEVNVSDDGSFIKIIAHKESGRRDSYIYSSASTFEKIFDKIPEVQEVQLIWTTTLQDAKGNQSVEMFVVAEMTRANAESINWKSFNPEKLPQVADVYKEHRLLTR